MPVLGAATLELNADTAKFEQDLGRAVQQATAFGTTVGTVLGQAITKAAEKIYDAVVAAVEYRSKLDDLADTTGDAVLKLDGLARSAQISGVAFSQLETALPKLARSLDDANDSGTKAAKALAAIGLNVDEVRKLKPADAFVEISKALGQFEDGAGKVAVAQALLGREGAKLLPLMKDLAEEGVQQGKVTAEQAAQAERLGKEWNRLKLEGDGLARTIASTLIPWVGDLIEQFRTGKELAGGMYEAMKLFGTMRPIGTTGEAISAIEDYTAAIGKLEQQKKFLTDNSDPKLAARETAALDAEIADYQKRIKFAELRLKQLNKDGLKAFPEEPGPAGKPGLQFKAADDAVKARERITDGAAEAARREKQIEDEAAAATQDYYRKIGEANERRLKEMQAQAEKSNAIITEAIFKRERGQGPAFDEDTTGMEKVKNKVKETDDFARQMGLTFSSAFEAAVLGGKKLSGVLQGLARDIAAVVLRKAVTEPLGNAISGAVKDSDFGKGIGDFFANLFKAEGGPVNAGQGYIVGERGPEWFVPNTAGSIVPNGGMGGGGVTVVQHINVDSRSDLASVREAMAAAKDAAVREVAAACQAGGSYAAMVRGA